MHSYCCYCRRAIVPPLKKTTEHIIPKSKGGSNHIANKRRCCDQCNAWRGNKSLDYWKWEVQYYADYVGSYKSYKIYDMEMIIINIDYIANIISNATPDMFNR